MFAGAEFKGEKIVQNRVNSLGDSFSKIEKNWDIKGK